MFKKRVYKTITNYFELCIEKMVTRTQTQVALAVVAFVVIVAVLMLIHHDGHLQIGVSKQRWVKPPRKTITAQPNMTLTDQLIDPSGKPIPCFYINRDNTTAKNDTFLQKAKDHNLECVRIPGIDRQDAGNRESIEQNGFAIRTYAGCTASHLKAVKHAFDLDLDYALVLEDDATFELVDSWPNNVITNLLKDTPEYVGVVQLFWEQRERKYASFVVPTHVARGTGSCNTSAYIVTKRGMNDILSTADNKHETSGVDTVYDHPKESVANTHFDLTRLCTSGLPLFCVDIGASLNAKRTNILLYNDVSSIKRIYNDIKIVYKHHWPDKGYRVGDAVMGKYNPQYDKWYHIDMYPNSLAALYFTKTGNFNDLDVLTQVVKEFQEMHRMQIPLDNDIVLHLRLGDIIESSKYSVDEHLCNEYPSLGDRFYVKPLSYFIKAFESFNPGMRVVIMYGSHLPELGFSKSDEYVNKIMEHLRGRGFIPHVRFGKGADEDFVFGAFAQQLVTTVGGYSELLSEVNKRLLSWLQTSKAL